MRFLLCSLVSSIFIVHLRYSFFNGFSFIAACLMAFIFSIPKYLLVSISPSVLIFLALVVLFLPSYIIFCFSLLAWHIFRCQFTSLYCDCIFSLPGLGLPVLHFSQTVWYRPWTLVIDLFLWFSKLITSCAFLSIRYSIIIIIIISSSSSIFGKQFDVHENDFFLSVYEVCICLCIS